MSNETSRPKKSGRPVALSVAAAVVICLLSWVLWTGAVRHTAAGASREDVIDAQVWFETCGEAAGLSGPDLKACIEAEKPVPTTVEAASTSTMAPPTTTPAVTVPTPQPPAPPTTARAPARTPTQDAPD